MIRTGMSSTPHVHVHSGGGDSSVMNTQSTGRTQATATTHQGNTQQYASISNTQEPMTGTHKKKTNARGGTAHRGSTRKTRNVRNQNEVPEPDETNPTEETNTQRERTETNDEIIPSPDDIE